MNTKVFWKTARLIAISALPAILFISGLWLADKVYAGAQTTYPGGGSVADVAIRGPNSGNNAANSNFEITTDGNYGGTVRVTVVDACVSRTAGVPGLRATLDTGGGSVTKDTNGGDCQGNDGNDLVFPYATMGPTDPKYNGQLKSIYLHIYKINGQGHQPFYVRAQGGNASVSFAGDPNRGKTSFDQDGFVIFPSPTVTFAFTPTCDFNDGDIYLKWQDADVGTLQPSGAYWHLDEYKPDGTWSKNVDTRTNNLGGDGAKRVAREPIKAGYQYKWVWERLRGVNALQVLVPFSQNSFDVGLKCNTEPTGKLTKIQCDRIEGMAADAQDGTPDWRITVGRGSDAWVKTGNGKNINENVNLSDQFTVGSPPGQTTPDGASRHVTLEVRDVGGGGNYQKVWENDVQRGPCYHAAVDQLTCDYIHGYLYSEDNKDNQHRDIKYKVEIWQRATPDYGGRVHTFTGTARYSNNSYGDHGSFTINDTATLTQLFNNNQDRRITIMALKVGGDPNNPTDFIKVRDVNKQYKCGNPPTSGTGSGSCFSTTVTTPRLLDGHPVRKIFSSVNTYQKYTNWYVNAGPGKTFTYHPVQQSVRIIIITQEYINGWRTEPQYTIDQTSLCYHAKCNIDSVIGDGPNGIVRAGHSMQVTISLTNDTGENDLPDPYPYAPWYWYVGVKGTGGDHRLYSDLTRGETKVMNIYIPAPANAQMYPLSFTPWYTNGGFSLGSPCTGTGTVDVYEHFTATLDAKVQLTPDSEDPTGGNYYTQVCNSASVAVNIPTHSTLDKQPGGATLASADTPPPATPGYGCTKPIAGSLPPVTISAGNGYCAQISAQYTQGYVGGGGPGDLQETKTSGSAGPDCATVYNQPYAQFFGSDVSAGGGFREGCMASASAGYIKAYDKGTNSGALPRGSGGQFGVQALDIIEGVPSANLRSNPPTGLMGLTFANTTSAPPTGLLNVQELGGKVGVSNYCVPNYFSRAPKTTTGVSPSVGDTANNGVQYYDATAGAEVLNGDTLSNGTKQVIYVKGDVYITRGSAGGIKYSTAARSSIKDIPSFYLIAKGNIYISPGVTQLDGVYVAQPSGSSGGHINTCAQSTGAYSVTDIYDSCQNQLTVNGAFVADKVLLNRSYSSLRYSTGGENPFGGGAHNCGVVFGSSQDCAAEIFNFSPELFMSQPAFAPSEGPQTGKYDSITSLAPVL